MIDALDDLIADSVISAVTIAPAVPDASFGDELDPIDGDDEVPDFVTPAFGQFDARVPRRKRHTA